MKNSSFEVLSNTKNIQAIRHNKLKISGIVFHEPGEIVLNDELGITVKLACLVPVNQEKAELSISDPTPECDEIVIEIDWKDFKSRTQTVKLPSGGFAGKSVSVNFF